MTVIQPGLAWRPLGVADLPLLSQWLREPQVARWWNHETTMEAVERDFGPSVRGEEPGQDLVVLLDDQPIGLIQRSVIADYPDDLAELSTLVDVPKGRSNLITSLAMPSIAAVGSAPK